MQTKRPASIRHIYATVVAGMLVLTAAIYLIGLRPLAGYLEETHGRTIDHELDRALWTFDNIVAQHAVLGFSEIIKEGLFGPAGNPRYREYAADIHCSGLHLVQLIDDLLDLAKIESGRVELAPEPIDLPDQIADCLRLVGERASNHGLRLEQRLADDLPRLSADRRALRQMLFNLLSNAVKFTPAGGCVTVWAEPRTDGGLTVAVADSGIGIAEDDRERLFLPFARTAEAEHRQIEGTGLGLVLVKALMERHGGSVSLSSAHGRGSTFALIFPAEASLPAEPGQAPAALAV
jgi:signal transduction histidine kinase